MNANVCKECGAVDPHDHAITCSALDTRVDEQMARIRERLNADERQHVSDAAWARMQQETLNYFPERMARHQWQDEFMERGIMVVTVDEWDTRKGPVATASVRELELEKLAHTALIGRDAAVDELTKANQSLLDANMRIEWLERQLRKADAGVDREDMRRLKADTERYHQERAAKRKAERAQHAPLLTTPNLTDPRLGR